MFLNYESFCLFESKDGYLAKAEKLMSGNKELISILDDCVNGVYPQIQISLTQGSTSYIAVATNGGNPECEVFKTSDARKALLGMIIKNTSKEDIGDLIGIIQTHNILVEYSVFAGNKKLSDEEMNAKYSLMYSDFSPYAPFFMGTPIIKKF